MSLQHAILGFLAIRPMSGYELKHAFDGTVAHFWTADQAQIYRTLARLSDAGQVTVRRIAQDGRPDRNEHRITAAGVTELDGWLARPHPPQPTREAFLLQLFFAGRLGTAAVRRLLQARVDDATAQLAVLEAIAAQHPPSGDHANDLGFRLRLATLDNGITHTRAELEWARTLLTDLTDRPPDRAPAGPGDRPPPDPEPRPDPLPPSEQEGPA